MVDVVVVAVQAQVEGVEWGGGVRQCGRGGDRVDTDSCPASGVGAVRAPPGPVTARSGGSEGSQGSPEGALGGPGTPGGFLGAGFVSGFSSRSSLVCCWCAFFVCVSARGCLCWEPAHQTEVKEEGRRRRGRWTG